MSIHTAPADGRDLGVIDVLVVLLLLHSAVALLSAVGLLVFAAVTGMLGALAVLGPMALGSPVLLLVLAAGVARRRAWARLGAVIFEGVTLLGVNIGLTLDRLPQIATDLGLAGLLTSVCLPVLVIVLAMSPAARRVMARRPCRLSDAGGRIAAVTPGIAGAAGALRLTAGRGHVGEGHHARDARCR